MMFGHKESDPGQDYDPCDFLRGLMPHQSVVVAQLGQSLDGRIATMSGDSQWINGRAALTHLHRLRANVDAVVVGVGTVLADDPMLTVRHVAGQSPARVVIDPSGRLPHSAQVFNDDGAARYLITSDAAECAPKGVEVIAMMRDGGMFPPMSILEALRRRGLRRILIEGGACTISQFMDADVIDRLHVLVAPLILGSGKPGLALRPISHLADANRPNTRVVVLGDGDVLFDCDLLSLRQTRQMRGA